MRGRVAFVLGLVVVGSAGCAGDRAPPPVPDPEPPPAPTPPPGPDLSLGRGYTMGHPVVDDRITLIPVFADTPPDFELVSLTTGMATGQVIVTEAPGIPTDSVWIENTSGRTVIALRGELVIDAHQDRVIMETAVITPTNAVTVPVRCVEAGRSSGLTEQFNPGRAIAEVSLRRTLRYTDQAAVWAQVDAINARLGLDPPTRTYRLAAARQTEGEARVRRDQLVAVLAEQPDRGRMVGLGVAVDGRMIALDRFATPGLYRQYEPMLVASYLAVDEPRPATSRDIFPDDVRAFARAAGVETATGLEALRPVMAPSENPVAD